MKIRRLFILIRQVSLLTLTLFAASQSQSGQLFDPALDPSTNNPTSNNTTDRLIIKFKPTTGEDGDPEDLNTLVEAFTGASSTVVRETFSGAHVIQLNRRIALEDMRTLTGEIARQPHIEYAEADLIMTPQLTPNDPRYAEQWHYFQQTGGINLPLAWDLAQGETTVVAVIDSGYQPHTDLNANLLPGYDMVSDEFAANDGDGRDGDATDPGNYAPSCNEYISDWHGTHVAGTVSAVTDNALGIAGVAYRAKVVPVRVLGRCGGYLSDITDGIVWAAGAEVAGAPINPNPAQVINMSLGGRSDNCPETALAAIDIARQRGASIVVAAGNNAEESSGFAPANCPGAITVAATDDTGELASFSNFGATVDLAAPGTRILSTHNDGVIGPGSESYRLMSGTSMSTPHVSGVAALLYGIDPGITPDEVADILNRSARPFTNACTGCGSGILDARAAVEMVTSDEPGVTILHDGVAETGLNGDLESQQFFAIDVPPGASSLSLHSYGGSGDADLYLRSETKPGLDLFDCRPYLYGNDEECVIRPVPAGRYYVMLHGYSAFSDLTLVADYLLDELQPDGESFDNSEDHEIPQSSLSGALNPIQVDRTGASGRVRIEVGIIHQSVREISVTLIDPSGAKHNLKGFGGIGVDLFETYHLELAEQPSEGEWTLQVKDLGNRGRGYIDFWRISFP
ncbi:MAG: S8 family serine peptidase [Candidatus Thiodiazotropha lotti]|nr:S8 family serine peptidase [Candidatus Thiodiazotropha lotti]MCG7999776.1 S8 family serine peptidase [Candidatus Thiodiazotropha lotti]MCW4182053.1 S8 family serine peptidase [Candidatus Thiodiazotropha weberae]MCW4191545.1 S8 family serine peptidase [Candidatus Thiodiazotropha weberae]